MKSVLHALWLQGKMQPLLLAVSGMCPSSASGLLGMTLEIV